MKYCALSEAFDTCGVRTTTSGGSGNVDGQACPHAKWQDLLAHAILVELGIIDVTSEAGIVPENKTGWPVGWDLVAFHHAVEVLATGSGFA
jgi:hypothetical protein